MERTFSPMIRQFSAIDGLQKAYTLVYSMDADDESGCRLTPLPHRGSTVYEKPVHRGGTRVRLPDPAVSV